VLAYRYDGKRCRLLFQVKPGSYNTDSLIGFLDELRRHFRGRRVILVWDGLPAHRSVEMTDYLRRQAQWLTVERLPGYAHIVTHNFIPGLDTQPDLSHS